MEKIKRLIDNLNRLGDVKNDVIVTVLTDKQENIVNQVRSQLMDGMDGGGKGLRPTYLEDRFFKTRQQAIGYMNWKQKITPNSRRAPESPNLFINGFFHSLLFLKVEKDQAMVTTSDSFGNNIVEKYGQSAFGVNNLFIQEEIFPLLKGEVLKQFRIQLGI